jgi:hypothetical protein
MGRLVGIPYFSSSDAFSDQQQDAAELRRAKAEKSRMDNSKGKEVGKDQQSDPVKLKQVESSHRMHKRFEGRLLRRTTESIGIDGKPLMQLPKCTIHYIIAKLTPRETEIIESITEVNLNR